MSGQTCIVIGGKGFVGRAITAAATGAGMDVVAIDRSNYSEHIGASCDLLINANGNARRFKAREDPAFDFDASVSTVARAIQDFEAGTYVQISSVDVYGDTCSLETTREDSVIDIGSLCAYGFHKRLAELIVMNRCEKWYICRLSQMVGDGLCKGPVYDIVNCDPMWVSPDTTLQFMRTSMVAATILSLLENAPANSVYNVCGRGSVSIRDLISLFPPQYREVSFAGKEEQSYLIDTQRTERYCELPSSGDEIRAFVQSLWLSEAGDRA